MPSMRSNLILLALCVALTGCGADPDRNVKETLFEKDVVGTWKMSTNSLGLLVRDGFRSNPTHRYTITFGTDGTCVFESVESLDKHRYVSASGTWRLEHDTQGDSNVKKKNALKLELRVDGERHIHYLNIAKENGVLILWNYHSDPDLWEFIEYGRDGQQGDAGNGP